MSLLSIGSSNAPARPLEALAQGAARLAREWALWRARYALGRLDDAMLHDIGLSRGEIDGATRHGRRGLRGRR